MKRLMMLTMVAWMAFVGMANAGDQVVLFKDFSYGMQREEVRKKAKAAECGKSVDGYDRLCVANYTFLGNQWKAMFFFEDNKLVTMSLVGDMNQKKLLSTIDSLSDSFILLSVQGNQGSFDLLSEIKSKGADSAFAALSQFERTALYQSSVKYVMLEKRSVENLLGKSTSIADLIDKSPLDVREVDVDVHTSGFQSSMAIRFYVPLVVQQEATKKKSAPKEKF